MEIKKNDQNFEGLDALRGVLSIIVCLAHSWQTFISPTQGELTTSGYIFGLSARFAVLCFFCLSGYVIALSVHKNISRIGRFSIWEYFLSRAFRIIPPVLFVIILAAILAHVLRVLGMDSVPATLSSRPTYVSIYRDQINCLVSLCRDGDMTGYLNGPLWSLKFEIQLYTITAVVAFSLFSRSSLIFRVLSLSLLYAYLKVAYPPSIVGQAFNMQAIWYLAFALGALTYTFFNRFAGWKALSVVCVALIASVSFFASASYSTWLVQIDTSRPLILAQVAFAVASAAFVLFLTRVRTHERFAQLGSFSYTLYILHYPLLLFIYFCVFRVTPKFSAPMAWILAACAAAAAVYISKLVSAYVENPSRHREWVAQRLNL